jgi:hypothetical protein
MLASLLLIVVHLLYLLFAIRVDKQSFIRSLYQFVCAVLKNLGYLVLHTASLLLPVVAFLIFVVYNGGIVVGALVSYIYFI